MAINISNVINIFSKFLDEKSVKISKLKTIEDVKELPIYSFKFLEKSEAKVLKDILDISSIEDASKLNKEDPFENIKLVESTKDPIKSAQIQEEFHNKLEELKVKNPSLEENLQKAITISSIIMNIKDDEDFFKKARQKVIVVGLDNAGKTAILNKFGGKLGIEDLATLTPTKGVDRRNIEMEDSDVELFIWDMGGQKKYRDKYLKQPEQYFLELDLLIYVIDIQDPERYAESFEYFEEILKSLKMLEEDPFIMVYIHKHDPDLRRNPEIELSVELLKDNLNQLLTQYGFDFEAYLTSIYSLISNEPEFSKYIKDVMKSAHSLTNPTLKKVEGLGKTLEETMNAVIRLSESISKQLNDLDSRLRAIESGAFQIAQSGIPIGITGADQATGRVNPADSRSQVLNELKQLFDKKRKLSI